MIKWDFLKVALPPSSVIAAWGFCVKWFQKRRERALLDLLERAGEPISVSGMHNAMLGHLLRDIPLRYTLMTVRPGGDPLNEDDAVAPKTPLPITLKYWWRRSVMQELPAEKKLRDTLRSMKERGLVDYVAEDFWRIAHK
jgi:hypothetical protein